MRWFACACRDFAVVLQGNITDNATVAFNRSDAFTHGGVISGTANVTKAGTGTLTLSGANTSTGGTTVAAGTLALGAANALPSASAISVSSGATLNLGNFSATFGSLAGAGSITGFAVDKFTLNTSGTFTNPFTPGAWSVAQSGNNLMLNYAGASAIPEPSTYAGIFGAAALFFAAWRRRHRAPAGARGGR